MHRRIEEAELAERHERPHTEDRAPGSVGLRDQEDRWYQHDGEANGGEEQRRNALHAPADDQEIEAPDGDDQRGKAGVTAVHT